MDMKNIKKYIAYMFLTLYSICCIYPIIWMVFYSFKNNEEILVSNSFGFPAVWRFENYVNAWKSFNIPMYFKNSIFISAISVGFTIIISLMFAYATARMTWRMSTAARIYITAGMFIPVQIVLIPLVILVKNLHLTNTYTSLILPYVAFQMSFACIVFHGFLRSLPFEVEEAAYMDGASILRTFAEIIVPMVKPAIASVLIFTFLNVWNEFMVALILINKEALKTLPLGLVSFKGQFMTDWGGMGAAMVIAAVPTIIVYLIFSEQVEHALTVGSAVKG
jgi:raffinose/stachyose/melibiose transport system permease protein